MEITEIIKYFARFPQTAGVLKNFTRLGSKIDGYSELQNYISALPAPLMPELTDLVFSTDEKAVGERIRNIDNYFMYIEYGPITADAPDRVRLRRMSFNLAVYVCYHANNRNLDTMEEALIMDKCLQHTFALAAQMITDDNLICPHTRFAESVLNFSPVEPMLMYQSIGWGLTFKKSNNVVL